MVMYQRSFLSSDERLWSSKMPTMGKIKGRGIWNSVSYFYNFSVNLNLFQNER